MSGKMLKYLYIEHPEIAKEYDSSKNTVSVNSLGCGDIKKYFWLCPLGHSYEMSVALKVRGCGCPVCAGKKAVVGFNDFESRYPDLAKEWHPSKNGTMTPKDVTYGSGIKCWWLCKYNHEYQQPPRDRVKGYGCPICFGYRKTSFSEQAIFYYFKKAFPNTISRYKDIFTHSMELDVYVPELKLGIEFDGAQWHKDEKQHQREIKKYQICKNNGIYLVRVKEKSSTNWKDTSDDIFYIDIVRQDTKELEDIINALLLKYATGITANIEKDNNEILSYMQSNDISLLSEFPEISKEWNYDKNNPMTPDLFAPYSNTKVWWKCSLCGKNWKTAIVFRTTSGEVGCKECSAKRARDRQIVNKINTSGSLYDLYPELMKEWDPSNIASPKEVLPGSTKLVKWKCSKCLKTWEATIVARTGKGRNCPYCSHQKIATGENDLKTTNPFLAKEWNYTKNLFGPEEVMDHTNKKVWWLCSKCGYEWEQSPNNRSKGSGCPCCSGRVPKIGVNDLKTTNPILASEWDYELNGDLKPEMFLPQSGRNVHWICRTCGHKWERTIKRRTLGSKCPVCSKNNK